MKKFLVGLVGILVVVCSVNMAVAQEVITIRVADFAPNYFKDEAGNWTGLSVELADAIVKAAGLTPEFVELPWSRAIDSLKSGKLHYMTNLYQTEERSEFLHWIGPIWQDRMNLVVKEGNETLPISTLDELVAVCQNQQKKFGYQQDISYGSDEFDQRIANDADFQACFDLVVDVESNITKTVRDRVLGFFESTISMRYKIRTNPAYKGLAVHPYILSQTPVVHGVSKAGVSAETLEKLRAGYQKCVEDATIKRILEKWEAQ